MPIALIATISHDLFTSGVPLAEKVVRTVAVYGGILVLLRLAGKRDLAQLNNFDLVVLLLLSNVVQNAVIGNDNSLIGGLLGAATLLGANSAVVRLARRSEAVTEVLEGSPTPIVTDGRIDEAAVARLGLRRADVIVALRRQGGMRLEDVQEAILEPGGSIVLTLRPQSNPAVQEDIARIEAKLDQLLAR